MAMKGSIQPNHIPVNKFEVLVVGLPPLTVTNSSGLEEELQVVELPDNTKVSGGRTGPSEFTITIPLHHTIEVAAMELWFRESQDPVTPTYKKAGSLIMTSIGLAGPTRIYNMIGMFPMKRKLSEGEMKNDGDMATVEWSMCVDQIIPQ